MLQYKWESTTITTNAQANAMVALFEKVQPKVGSLDTETTGLHIILDKPFVVQFGFLDQIQYVGYTFAVDLEKQPLLGMMVLQRWCVLASMLEILLGANIKYDLHMMTNIGLPPYPTENYSDTQFYIRYAHDALTPANGGPPLGLKDYVTRYIDHTGKAHEKQLASERSQIAKEYNLRLKIRLNQAGKPPERYKAKSYTLKVLDEMFKDPTFELSDLPTEAYHAYLDWLQLDLPIYLQKKIQSVVEADMIPYNVLDRGNLIRYAHKDIVYTLEVWLKTKDVVILRGNQCGVELENKLILPLYEMEREGFLADKLYLEQARLNMKSYIGRRRADLFEMTGVEFTVGQHEVIKNLLYLRYGVPVSSTNSEVLNLIKSELLRAGDKPDAVTFIDTIQELRTLEKWYSAYILRFLKDLRDTDHLYTTIHQVGTVSGRVTSDFQQFPKKPIYTVDGTELFNPRRIVLAQEGDYDALVYLDYSQIELRLQAFYTILVGHPDLNLCRAYMPFQCLNNLYGNFDYSNPDHVRHWSEPWYKAEEPEVLWSPVDVHAATTIAATGLDESDPEFHYLRSAIGKRTNFAKQYGAKINRIRQMYPTSSEEEVARIDAAYYIAFPGVKVYHEYCMARAEEFPYTENLFGIRYYGVSGHKLINLLIQGSAAFFLKVKIRELYEYSKANQVKSRWQMNIHDELSWKKHKDELDVFFEFKRIMEEWEDSYVPIVAEMEITNQSWADKKGVKYLDEIHTYLGY